MSTDSARWCGLFLLTSSSCQQVAGISHREYASAVEEEDAGASEVPTLALCTSYCDETLANCTDELAVYSAREGCMGVCMAMPAGAVGEADGQHSVVCRLNQARLARASGEASFYCPRADVGGAALMPGGTRCGSDCESYCQLSDTLCPENTVPDCVQKCTGLPSHTAAYHSYAGDSLQCRLAHLGAATLDPDAHCPHTTLAPQPGDAPCDSKPDAEPNCRDFCRLVMVACEGEDAAYASREQCLSVCASLEKGVASDTSGDTLGCRRHHAYAAFSDPSACTAASPSGGDVCRAESR